MSSAAPKAVFLSYASQDAEAARRIAEALRGAGIEVWFDQSELRGGDAWDSKIRKQIKDCALFVPVISANTQARREGYFRREWHLAVDRTHDMDEGLPFLVPVVIDDIRDAEAFVPEKFREVQWTRLSGGEVTANFIDRVQVLLKPTESAKVPCPAPGIGTPRTPAPSPTVTPGAAPPQGTAQKPDEGGLAFLRRPRIAIPAFLVAVGLAVAAWWSVRLARVNWAITEALPEITRLVDTGEFTDALALAAKAGKILPKHAKLESLIDQASVVVTLQTDVPGAQVDVADYAAPDGAWQSLGTTPVDRARVSRGLKRWRITKAGYEPIERVFPAATGPVTLRLAPAGSIPTGMVHVAAVSSLRLRLSGLDHLPLPLVDEFLMDRHEVSNREFAAFVAAGGYRKTEYWKHPVIKDGRTLSADEISREFRDSTGQPGPATWESGTYLPGQADLPVGGVSWYEAAAYAEYAGKALPSIYHWDSAALSAFVANATPVIRASNFGGQGPISRGQGKGINTYGTFDLAGNLKEWCWNATDSGLSKRYILGGAWNEPVYMFNDPDAQSPLSRLPNYGFRCVRYLSPVLPQMLEPVEAARRDIAQEKPAPDEVFEIYRSFYAYDRTPLAAVVESVDPSSENWKCEKITFAAGYANERVTAYLYLPRNAEPPFQTIVYYPGSPALRTRTYSHSMAGSVDFILRSGRAVIVPIYKSTFERGDGLLTDRPSFAASFRDHIIYWYKDFARSIDYLESRPDIDGKKLGYYGTSWGAVMGPILLGLDSRCRAAVWSIGGFWLQKAPPEVEQLNFAPRVKIPVLMLNGRFDFIFPVETAQAPMFKWLGTPEASKRHMLFDSGHSVPRKELITETLGWFDRHLGPVK